MWIELPVPWIIALNCLGIPAVHLGVSWWTTRLPRAWFGRDRALFRERRWEKSGDVYERCFHIRRWKKWLPDAAPWFAGFAKGRLQSIDPEYLDEFIAETRRGEFAHWIQMVVIAAFVAWNPYPANWVIVAYGVLSNVPCLLSLRHTRLRLQRLIGRLGTPRAGRPGS
ncbi:hypothetical protein [Luteolibacter marinus]|uniref:glycosyl-4,4'-diaponeurosporenoate acyltransferase CrtO family protein n=1 Tax=Luteolibacter marinus TaxID=2776705 RepID=UPI001866304F|nr:hypothetical protein [Luteolibacter marinus]